MTAALHAAEPDINSLFEGLRDLERYLTNAGINKHDRAHMLINACIGEGVDTGARIIGVLAKLGYDKRHAGIILKAGIHREPEWPNWGRRENGVYYAPPEPS